MIPSDKDLDKAARRRARKGKPVKPSRVEEARLRKAVNDLWKTILLPATERIKDLVRAGASPAEIAKVIEDTLVNASMTYGRYAQNIVDSWIAGVDREVANAIYRATQEAIGIDLTAVLAQPDVADALSLAGTQASMLIKTIPQEYLGKVAQAVADNFSGRDLPEGRSLLEQIQHLGGVSYRRAKLIARDQTSKLTASLNEHRQTAIGIDEYVWRTVKDQRVVGNPNGRYPDGNRKHGDHYHLDGKRCKWSDPTVYSDDNGKTWKKRPSDWSQSTPGQDIQCRCWAEPIIDPEKIIAYVRSKK